MVMTHLSPLTISEAAALLARRDISSLELTENIIERIHATEPYVHAYVRVFDAQARAAAHQADILRAHGAPAGPLLGIPVGVKDLFFTIEGPTEAGSRVLEGYTPGVDAGAVARLRAAGAVILGKTVTHEFAYGMSTPPTRNPWHLESYPGGSSAG